MYFHANNVRVDKMSKHLVCLHQHNRLLNTSICSAYCSEFVKDCIRQAWTQLVIEMFGPVPLHEGNRILKYHIHIIKYFFNN